MCRSDDSIVPRVLSVLRYYADEENYNNDGALVYENIGPPIGWLGEEYESCIELDKGKAARQVLMDLGHV